MKRICGAIILSWFLSCLCATAASAAEPVYIYLYARVTDHVNLDLSEDSLRRVLPMIERYRAEHPEAHVSATILFSGAVSHALDQRNAKTKIRDYVLDFKKRGVIEVGYDGSDEPTYDDRPMSNLADTKTPEDRWLARASADEKFLTEARDPLTGAPLHGAVGGLREMQRVFGEASCITGVSVGEARRVSAADPREPGLGATPSVKPEVGDWEVVPLLRRYNSKAIIFGIPDANPAHVPGFGGSKQGIGDLMSPVPESSPELYWADNVLRSSESGGAVVRVVHGYEGVDGIKDVTGKMDRSKIRILHVELASENYYLKSEFNKSPLSPALTYAYAHPDHPQVPAESRSSADEIKASFAKEEALLKWLTTEYFPANPGSHMVSSSDLRRMTAPSIGYSISMAEMQAALAKMLTTWGNDTFPPAYLRTNEHYLSLAETFQVMTDALAELDRTGKLPQSVRIVQVYGPIGMPAGHGPNAGEVTVASVSRVCSQLAPGLHNATANPMPKNTVPPFVTVGGIDMNAAQFLRLMAQAMVNPIPETKLRVRMVYMFSGVAEIFPKTRMMQDTGATWTFKPAPLDVPLPSIQALKSTR